MTLAQAITRIIDFFYIKPFEKIVSRITFRYVVCGGINVLLGWLIYALLYKYLICAEYLDLGFVFMSRHTLALFIQFPITFLVGFLLNRYVTFAISNLSGKTQLIRYVIQNAGSFLLSYLVLKLFVEVFSLYAPTARPIADVIVVIYSYLTARFFTFRLASKEE